MIEKFNNDCKDFLLTSIITVVFNDKKFLEETICSIINQSYKNVHFITIVEG